MKILILFFIFIPLAFAFDCGQIMDKKFCGEVMESNLSSQEKDMLLSAALIESYDFPNYGFIENWNDNIKFSAPPLGTEVYSSGSIQDAWHQILSINPSVFDKKLLSPGYGNIKSAYNYSIRVPSGTMSGDCITYHYAHSSNAKTEVYLNGNLIGEGTKVGFISNANLNFVSKLTIQSTIRHEHYRNQEYCCKWYKRSCQRYCNGCIYSWTDYSADTLAIPVNLSVYYYDPIISPSLNVRNKYYNTIEGQLIVENATSFDLKFDEAVYQRSHYDYALNRTLVPYYVLQWQAIPHEESMSKNINIRKQNSSYICTIEQSNACLLSYKSHFSSFSKECSLDFSSNNLTITIDRLSYLNGETLNVDLFPKDTKIILSYGNQSMEVINNTSLNVSYPYNKITAVLDNSKVEKVFAISEKSHFAFFTSLATFSFISYVIYGLIKKYFPFKL